MALTRSTLALILVSCLAVLYAFSLTTYRAVNGGNCVHTTYSQVDGHWQAQTVEHC